MRWPQSIFTTAPEGVWAPALAAIASNAANDDSSRRQRIKIIE
jgi:hypothetical protein